jgi:hypothetical protein
MTTKLDALKFNDLFLAQNFAARCKKIHMVIMGDDGMYWVVTMATAQRLVKAGYELAESF